MENPQDVSDGIDDGPAPPDFDGGDEDPEDNADGGNDQGAEEGLGNGAQNNIAMDVVPPAADLEEKGENTPDAMQESSRVILSPLLQKQFQRVH